MKLHQPGSDVPPPDSSQAAVSHNAATGLDLARMQRDQYRHDMRNHFDILALHKHDRLKHYGLHYAKYVGRVARDSREPKGLDRTIIDTLLICLSAANTLHQDLGSIPLGHDPRLDELGHLRFFADAAGRFGDACEKIDHLEDFRRLAEAANVDILNWVIWTALSEGVDLVSQVRVRREQLARRQFFIET